MCGARVRNHCAFFGFIRFRLEQTTTDSADSLLRLKLGVVDLLEDLKQNLLYACAWAV